MKLPGNFIFILVVFLSAGCGGDSDPLQDEVVYQFDLNNSDHNWQVGFADYPEGEEEFYELASDWKQLPAPLNHLNGLNVSGNNHSDDLFMYVKRKLEGLKPNTRYSLSFYIQFATNADTGCVGAGGPPGEGVVIKAGATHYEPVADHESGGSIRMNIDHGDHDVGGSDAIVIGDFANTQTDCTDEIYELKSLDNSSRAFQVFTGEEGSLWALFATDSGFEGLTSIYFTYLEIRAKQL
jgi:hypothetical protein